MQRRDRRRGSSGGRATRRERRCNAMEREGEGFDGEETGRSGGWFGVRGARGAAKSMHRRGMQRAAPSNTQSLLRQSAFYRTLRLRRRWSCLLYATTSFSGIRFSLNFPSPYPLSRITSSRTWCRDEVCRGPMFSINFSRGCNFLTFSARSISVDLG